MITDYEDVQLILYCEGRKVADRYKFESLPDSYNPNKQLFPSLLLEIQYMAMHCKLYECEDVAWLSLCLATV